MPADTWLTRAESASTAACPVSGKAESASRMSSTIVSMRVLDSVNCWWSAASSCSLLARLAVARLDALRERVGASRERSQCVAGLGETCVELLLGDSCTDPRERLDPRPEGSQHRPELVGRRLWLGGASLYLGLEGVEVGGLAVQSHLRSDRTRGEIVELALHRRVGRDLRLNGHGCFEALADRGELTLAAGEAGGRRRHGRRQRLEALADERDLAGQLVELLRAALLPPLARKGCNGLLQLLDDVRIDRRPSHAGSGGECLERLVPRLEIAPKARDLAVLLRDRGRRGCDRRGEGVDALREHVDARREPRLLLRVALRRRQHDSPRVGSTRAPLGTTTPRASSRRLSEREPLGSLTRLRESHWRLVLRANPWKVWGSREVPRLASHDRHTRESHPALPPEHERPLLERLRAPDPARHRDAAQ